MGGRGKWGSSLRGGRLPSNTQRAQSCLLPLRYPCLLQASLFGKRLQMAGVGMSAWGQRSGGSAYDALCAGLDTQSMLKSW